MRIIAGRLGSRQFDAPKNRRSHPMSQNVRGGLFNALGEITGLTMLDPFGGSGAVSFEALSRGASTAVIIENDRRAQVCIAANIKSLGLENQAKLIKANAASWSQTNPDAQFDLVVLAPPYDDLQAGLLGKLVDHAKPGGVVVLDWPGKEVPPVFAGFSRLQQLMYGDAQLVFYRKIS